MHIFLTGEIQIGKSTVIARTLERLNTKYGGFRTYFGPDRGLEDRWLYMNAAAEPARYEKESGIVEFRKDCMPRVNTEKFNTYGVELIKCARVDANLIVMDECGNFERAANKFQNEIIGALDQKMLVLGVLKLASSGWTDLIRNHNQVKLITVTKENRDELPARIIRYLTKEKML